MASNTKAFSKLQTTNGTKNLFTCFRLLGIIMPKNYKTLYVIYSALLNFFILVILPLSFTLSYIIRSANIELNQLITSLQLACNVYACVVKFSFLAYKRGHLFKLMDLLDNLDRAIVCPEQIHEAEKAIKAANRIVMIYFAYYMSYSVFVFVGSFYFGRPPYSLYIPFLNWRTSFRSFVLATVIECTSTNMIIFQGLSTDVYGLVFSELWHAHYKALIIRVEQIGRDPMCSQKENQKQLIQCIHYHRKILTFCETIAPLLSATYFVQFLATGVSLSLCLINIAISNDTTTLIGLATFSVGLVMEILPMCYMITTIKEENTHLAEAIFHLNWMDQSKEFGRTCTYFIHRSQQDMNIYAGKLVNITLDTFLAIMKFSFSLYTLLDKMNIGQGTN